MKGILPWFFVLSTIFFLASCDDENEKVNDGGSLLQLLTVRVGTYDLHLTNFANNMEAPFDMPVVVSFTEAVDRSTVEGNVELKEKDSGVSLPLTFSYLDNDKTLSISSTALDAHTNYQLIISDKLMGANDEKFAGHIIEFSTAAEKLSLLSLKIGETEVLNVPRITNVPLENVSIELTFSAPLEISTVTDQTIRVGGFTAVPSTLTLSNDNKTVLIKPTQKLSDLRKYEIFVSQDLRGVNDETFSRQIKFFYTQPDPTPDFPVISDDALLNLVQQQTFKYFWDFAQPSSGMARERNSSGELVTSGGSGFGIMALIVGMERSFITRAEGLERMQKILTFLENADRFHGAWSHWIDGNSGNVIPFSANDNGGDLVETSFLVQGLLAFRQYLDPSVAAEKVLVDKINALWESVEWNWYTKGGEDVLYWHWSPDKNWIMNHQIRGHNETLITYVLAASSPDYSIAPSVYHNGYARAGAIRNGNQYYGISLPLGDDFGGPLFFSHYSFLGLDPRNLTDTYTDYATQNLNHTLINQQHAIHNPKNWVGYSEENWGFTASDNQSGYSAHSPTNDLGVITPTAALSSFPYTPEQSMKALKFFYYTLGDRLWKDYGFVDAFNLTEGWVANSFLAIDQGPIIVMIENYRTGLLWDLFMSAPEVQNGLDKLGFTY